jgi:hypothetical protein
VFGSSFFMAKESTAAAAAAAVAAAAVDFVFVTTHSVASELLHIDSWWERIVGTHHPPMRTSYQSQPLLDYL